MNAKKLAVGLLILCANEANIATADSAPPPVVNTRAYLYTFDVMGNKNPGLILLQEGRLGIANCTDDVPFPQKPDQLEKYVLENCSLFQSAYAPGVIKQYFHQSKSNRYVLLGGSIGKIESLMDPSAFASSSSTSFTPDDPSTAQLSSSFILYQDGQDARIETIRSTMNLVINAEIKYPQLPDAIIEQ